MMSLNSFSQTGTKDTTKVCLPSHIARMVVTDLIERDMYEEELEISNLLLKSKTNKIVAQDALISVLEGEIGNYEYMMLESNTKYENQYEISKELKKSLQQQQAQSTLFKIGTAVGATGFAILLIVHLVSK